MKVDLPPLKSWQFFNACRKVLGDTFLTKVFNRGSRQIYRWSADPDFTSDVEKNPMDILICVLTRLSEIGRDDLVRAGLRIFAYPLGYEITNSMDNLIPDKASIEEECLDDYPALTNFIESIRNRENPDTVSILKMAVKKEIDETEKKYIDEYRRK